MKTTIKILLSILAFTFNATAQNVGINAIGADPDESALLDLDATDKGFLITRADTAAISSPAFGLMTLAPEDSCLYMHNGETTGRKWISIGGVGSDCPCGVSSPTSPPVPTFPCDGAVIPVVEVTSAGGKVWMDRNLGASQVATTSDDADAYGGLYQWGRCSDGHEKRNSGETTTLSASDDSGHDDFITVSASPYDWRSGQNDNFWQGVNGVNNPCPTGYRLPTDAELTAELSSWSNQNSAGALASPLKLSLGGRRNTAGEIVPMFLGLIGQYWSGTIDGTKAKYLSLGSSTAEISENHRAFGFSVRCIKD